MRPFFVVWPCNHDTSLKFKNEPVIETETTHCNFNRVGQLMGPSFQVPLPNASFVFTFSLASLLWFFGRSSSESRSMTSLEGDGGGFSGTSPAPLGAVALTSADPAVRSVVAAVAATPPEPFTSFASTLSFLRPPLWEPVGLHRQVGRYLCYIHSSRGKQQAPRPHHLSTSPLLPPLYFHLPLLNPPFQPHPPHLLAGNQRTLAENQGTLPKGLRICREGRKGHSLSHIIFWTRWTFTA